MSRADQARGFSLRLLEASDSIGELTALLHRAYRPLAERGFRFVASHQDEARTLSRISRCECCVAVIDGRIVGTILFRAPAQASGCPYYDRPDVATFHQFAVDLPFQSRGIGVALLEWAEARARETGAAELARDTAEGATDLIVMYRRRGYRIVGRVTWPEVNYGSVIMSRPVQGRRA
jgi:GNAT superfamily N-acetyltransferase